MKKLSGISRIAIIVASLCFLATFKFPFWVIYLTAPQYPEGLTMYIWLHKITGDIEIINGLNHYIGMATIHQESFPEFKILPYAMIFFLVSGLFMALLNRKKIFFFWVILLVLFSCLAIYDFWHWEYEYGHHLDPNAAIQIPGMTYQPPLIGYKQLLNFGAYSYPHGGGWFYISAVAISCLVAIFEIWKARKRRKHKV